jgi:predicted ribosomally synthesized peptide with SipW-like signal peptide
MPYNASIESTNGSSRGRLPAVLALVFSFLASMVVISMLVVTSSIAAFSDTTAGTGNTFSTGTVDLVDDDLGAVLFTATAMVPGDSVTDCITVTYQGSVANPSGVKLYSGGYVDSGDLDTYLNVTIEEGTGGSFGDCTGFTLENAIETGGTLSDFDTTHTNYATGAGVWDPASTPVSKTYRLTVALDAAAPNAEQGESVTAATFTWEVQS